MVWTAMGGKEELGIETQVWLEWAVVLSMAVFGIAGTVRRVQDRIGVARRGNAGKE